MLVYLATLQPTVGVRDSGEMISAAWCMGVPHPSGFPLYIIISRFFLRLPFAPAVAMNLMSAVFSAGAVVLVFLLLSELVCAIFRLGKKTAQITAIAGALSLAFSFTFWSYAVFAEKYSLFAFFSALLLFFAWRYAEGRQERDFYLLVFLLGLSLTHHLSAIFFILPLLYLAWKIKPRVNFVKSVVLFCLPMCLYFYLPMRAFYPPFEWPGMSNLRGVLGHIFARQYSYAFFSTPAPEMISRIKHQLAGNFLNQFTIAGIVLCLAGLIVVFKRHKTYSVFLVLAVLSNIIVVLGYNIVDQYNIDTYYFGAYMIFAVWIGAGIGFLVEFASRRHRTFALGILLLSLFYPVALGNRNLVYADRSRDYLARDYCLNLLNSVEDDSLLIVDGDQILYPLWYLHFVERRKPEVLIRTIRDFPKETVACNIKQRPVYFNSPEEKYLPEGYKLLQLGLVFRVVPVKYRVGNEELKARRTEIIGRYSARGLPDRTIYRNTNLQWVVAHWMYMRGQ